MVCKYSSCEAIGQEGFDVYSGMLYCWHMDCMQMIVLCKTCARVDYVQVMGQLRVNASAMPTNDIVRYVNL